MSVSVCVCVSRHVCERERERVVVCKGQETGALANRYNFRL